MRVAVLQSFLPSRSNGGVGHFSHQLSNGLVARGHTVTVFSLHPAPDEAAYTVVTPDPGVRLLQGRLGVVYGFGLWLARQEFVSFDVVHAMGDNHLIRTRTPVVRTIHGSALAEARHAPRLQTRLMFLSVYLLELVGVARANAAVGVSRNSTAAFPWVKLVIGQGVDQQRFTPGGQKSKVPSILFVGHRLRDRKRAYLLLEAFQNVVRPAVPEAELWLVCDDGVAAPGVRSFSNLSIEALADLYRRAWIFCLPSSYEGFGRPYVEAMASGTPVVATPNPGALEVLDNGRYGLITNARVLGRELVDLLGDAPRRAALARMGLERARAFDWETVTEQYEALYRRLAAREATGSALAG